MWSMWHDVSLKYSSCFGHNERGWQKTRSHKWISSTLAVIPYAEFMFSDASWKKLPTPFLTRNGCFDPFQQKRPKGREEKKFSLPRKGESTKKTGKKKNFPFPGREKFFPFPGRENFFPIPGREKVLKRGLFWSFLAFVAFETFTRRVNYL